MLQIVTQNKLASGVLTQPKTPEGSFRQSLHALRVPCADGVLLYHTLTGELLLLSEAQNAETDEKLRSALIEKRFLVPADFDEYAYCRQYRRVAELLTNRPKEITSFTVFTTTDCNARCPYCYELGRPRVPMSDQVARDAAAFIARVSGGKQVKLTWFGGEPLCNRRAIEIITAELRDRGVPFRSSMVTNGYLFDEQTVQTAKNDWALRSVQITLDGTESVYNRIKNYVHTEGSAYQRILRNIALLLAAGVRVSIRCNASSANLDDLEQLADELAARFHGEKRLKLYSVLLRDFGPAGSHPEAEAETLRRWHALQRRILSSELGGLRRLPRQPQTNGCMSDNDGSVTILPDGRLGKCEHESERLYVGNIYDGVTDRETVARWKERVELPECRSCAFAPTCIRLRLCAWVKDACTPADRERIRLSVEQMILNEYRHFLAGDTNKGEESDETETDAAFSGFGR